MKQYLYSAITVVCISAAHLCAHAQTITTVAGNGILGQLGDGGAATSAELFYPSGVTVDGTGSIYISDVNPNIRMVASTGIISNFAGNGTFGYTGDGGLATAAEIGANKIASDASGNVYIANANSVRKISTTGIITTVAGSSTPGFSGDGGPATAALLDGVFGLAIDAAGNIFIGDVNNFRVRKINTTGTITTYAGNGTAGNSGDGGMAVAAQIQDPTGLAVDGAGNLYIADNISNVIRKVTTSGTISTVAGTGTAGYTGDGGVATNATLDHASGVVVDGAGNLFIADLNNNVIRKVTAAGIISTYAGNGTSGFSGDGGPAAACELSQPNALALDGSGNMYVADNQNSRIRKISSAPNGIAQSTAPAKRLFVYPNPSDGIFKIEGSLDDALCKTLEIEISDMFGQVVYEDKIVSNNGQVNFEVKRLEAMQSGIYFVRAKYGQQITCLSLEIQR